MAGFDQPGLVTADRFFEDDQGMPANELTDVKARFKEFIRTYYNKSNVFKYRERLLANYRLNRFNMAVNIRKVQAFDDDLADNLTKKPTIYLPFFEDAAREVLFELTKVGEQREEGKMEDMPGIQIMLYHKDKNSAPDPTNNQYASRPANSIRTLSSNQVSRIVFVNGIIVAASQVRCKATAITLQCRSCRHTVADIPVKPGLDGYAMPRKCGADQTGQAAKCPIDPYYILPDKCRCVDFQTLKLQETPEDVPQGELPRHLQLYCDRYLTDQVAPGNRVAICGVYSIRKIMKTTKGGGDKKGAVGIRAPYLRVLGIRRAEDTVDPFGSGNPNERFTEDEFRDFARKGHPYVLDKLAKSIAPSIYGSEDIKKAIACLLFGGSKKRLPDGLNRRGDINVLLLGDPGTAKSQLLKFVEKAAPIGVYTSGKGSSAAGLTASVIRDPASRSFIMEGGAMVLADMGVVCIDEFDKMREDDRVAIHEAMEQQTISIAKAGITTTLNSRCSVLAAANSVYGRWDDTKGEENIDFMPTILSRFDMIFIVKDEHDEVRDRTLAKHVIQVHISGNKGQEAAVNHDNEKSMEFLRRYVKYCREHCGPRLSEEGGRKLLNHYVKMRNPDNPQEKGSGRKKSAIPITVRQLEAVVRISESLAKMELKPVAGEQHVDEALRLFQVSTIEAASSGNLAGVEGFTTEEDHEMLSRIEKQIKKRFAIGTQVSEHVIIQDFVRQNYKEAIVRKVLLGLIRRGDVQHRMQRKMLFRMK